jgi:hypothetical protein
MLTVAQIGEYLRVAGYPDGSDWWILLPHGRTEFSYGVAGPAHVWYGERGGRVYIHDAHRRRQLATVRLEGCSSPGLLTLPVTVSRDGRRLYVLEWFGAIDQGQGRVHVIDVSAGAVVAIHGPLPARLGGRPLERPDGRLLLPTRRQSLVQLDLLTGEWSESAVPGRHGAANFWTNGSPDGRYWIRFDPAALPVHETTPGFLERVRGEKKKAERRYGLTVQIWEAFPLRFVRRTVAAWLTAKELPDETQLARAKSRPAALPSRAALWDAIAAARAAGATPLDGPPPRSAYPPALAADDAAWEAVEKNLARLEGWIDLGGWQPDGAAFWVTTNGFLSCVGVDGTVSPRLCTERLGLEPGTWLPVAARWRELVPLAGRTARVIYNSGTALFDGAPRASLHVPHAISATRDGWQPSDPAAQERAAYKRLDVLREGRRRIVIPFGGWSEAGCAAAIDALTKAINEDFPRLAVSHEIRIVFASGDGEVDEERFFTEVGGRFGGAAPAMQRLIDRYCDVAERDHYLFSRGEEGIGIFAWAVKTLGVLDGSALPTLKRYGVFVDPEHEYYFAGTTVPAVVKAHGWTDDVVDFVFWVLAWNFYNTLDDYRKVWAGWGLRDAVVHREPRAFARHIAADLAETIRMKDDPGRYGIASLDKLAKQIPQPHESWAAAFFDELERIFAEPASADG